MSEILDPIFKSTVLVSGGFDPPHKGHIALLGEARGYGSVIVALNSDDWLARKKGFALMKWEDRAEVLRTCRYVDKVVRVIDDDGTVAEAILSLKPTYFANGGDRTYSTLPSAEEEACKTVGTKMLYGIGGAEKQGSSGQMFINAMHQYDENIRVDEEGEEDWEDKINNKIPFLDTTLWTISAMASIWLLIKIFHLLF